MAGTLGAVILGLLLAVAQPAGALQVHLRDVVFVRAGVVTIGEVATVAGGTQAEREQVSTTPLAAPVTRPTLVPAWWIRASLSADAPTDVSVTGRRMVLIPSDGLDGRLKLFQERLLRAIDTLDSRGDARMEVAVLSTTGVAPGQVGPELTFGAVDVGRQGGYPAGAGTVSYSAAGSTGSVSVWVHTYLDTGLDTGAPDLSARLRRGAGAALTSVSPPPPPAAPTTTSIRAGDLVTIVFVRGGITVTAPGRAQGSSSAEGTISVRSLDGRRLYTGRVAGATEVRVEIP